MVNRDRVFNFHSQGMNKGVSYNERSTCDKCRNQHLGKCLASTNGCFGCGKKVHKMRDCLTLMEKGREAKEVPLDGPNLITQRRLVSILFK